MKSGKDVMVDFSGQVQLEEIEPWDEGLGVNIKGLHGMGNECIDKPEVELDMSIGKRPCPPNNAPGH